MKRVLVVGATSGIGFACSRLWAMQGCRLFLVGRTAAHLDLAAHDARVRGAASVDTFLMDATDASAYDSLIQAVVRAFGQMDVALVSYGTWPDQKACEQNVGLAMQSFALNADTTIGLLTALGAHFERQGCGTLAVVSSVAGDRGRPSNYLYGSAKAAVSSFCEGLRARLFKSGVHVMTVKPGLVDTPMLAERAVPAILVVRPKVVAKDILSGIERRANVVYSPSFWAWVMWGVRMLPQWLFKRLSL